MPTLARISATPVKGTTLLHPERVELTREGIPGNRRFHLVDGHGRLVSGTEIPQLVQIRAELDAGTQELRLTFPDGRVVEGPASDLTEAVTTGFYGRWVEGRAVQGPFSDAFSDFAGRPVRLVCTDQEGDGPDVHRLTLVSFASVRQLAVGAGHDGELDSRRFRMNLELEGCDPYEEDSWDGRAVRVGEAVLRLHGQVPRCVVTNLDPVTGTKDFDTLRQLARQRERIADGRGLPFGMYAEIEEPGRASVGDLVQLEPI